MLAAEHVLCYLRGTWNQTIRYSRDSHENPNVLWGWVPIPHGIYSHDEWWTHFLEKSPTRQRNVSLSTPEAEFVAASLAGQAAIYLRETLTDFGFSQTKATLLYEDNLTCVAMSSADVMRSPTTNQAAPGVFCQNTLTCTQAPWICQFH